MKYLYRKLFRDIKKLFGQFASIMVVIALGCLIFAGMSVLSKGIDNTVNQFYKQTNLADIWGYFNSVSQSDINNIKSINGIAEAQGRLMLTTSDLSGETEKDFTIYIQNQNEINKPQIISGKMPASNDECIIDNNYLEPSGLKLYDSISVKINDINYTFKIVGTFIANESVYMVKDSTTLIPDFKNFGILYLNSDMLSVLTNGKNTYNQVLIKTDNNADSDKVISELSKVNGYKASITQSNHLSVSTLNSKLTTIKKLSSVLPIFFFLISAAMAFISMSRLVSTQTVQIGVMKALGTKSNKIMLHYLCFPMLFSVLGGAVGGVLGVIFLSQGMYKILMSYYVLPQIVMQNQALYIVVGIVISAFFGVVATWLSCRKVLKIQPDKLLRQQKQTSGKAILLERMNFIWPKISYKSKLMYRNIFLNKRRAILSSIGIAFGCALMIAVFSLQNGFGEMLNYTFNTNDKFDVQAIYSTPQDIDTTQQISGALAVDNFVKFNTSINNKSLPITALYKDNKSISLYDNKGNEIPLPTDGVVVSEYLAKQENIKIGDTISLPVTINGENRTLDVPVKAHCISYSGQGIYTSIEYLKLLNLSIYANGFYVICDNSADVASKIKEFSNISAVYQKSDLIAGYSGSMKLVSDYIYIVGLMAFILSLAIIFNLTTININERRRDIATMRVLGQKVRDVKNFIYKENIVLTAFGAIIGLFFGIFLSWVLMNAIATPDITMPFIINPFQVIIAIVTTFIFTVIANLMQSKKITGIDMVESLKGVE